MATWSESGLSGNYASICCPNLQRLNQSNVSDYKDNKNHNSSNETNPQLNVGCSRYRVSDAFSSHCSSPILCQDRLFRRDVGDYSDEQSDAGGSGVRE